MQDTHSEREGAPMHLRCLVCTLGALIGLWIASFICMVYRGVTGNIFWGQFGIWLAVVSAVPSAIFAAMYIVRNERLRAGDIAAIVIDRALRADDQHSQSKSLRVVD